MARYKAVFSSPPITCAMTPAAGYCALACLVAGLRFVRCDLP
jgi:hypothetical protein